MTDDISKGTAKGLIDYLESLIDRGRAPKGSVRLLITATKTILGKTEGEENWTQTKVLEVDTEDVIDRFKNLTLGSYREESYATYQSRLSRAINWYRTFLANPGWVPKTRGQGGQKETAKKGSNSVNPRTDSRSSAVALAGPGVKDDVPPILPELDTITYPFPLKNGGIARIALPNGIDLSDVDRMSAFLRALVVTD